MPFLTCFWHPRKGHDAQLRLQDRCEECDRQFDFPLENAPASFRDYRELEPISRGFYGAIYRAKFGRLGTDVVLKVIPAPSYRFFGKDFDGECQQHESVARDTDHLVGIRDAFEEVMTFGDAPPLACHVAVLDFVDGPTLGSFLERPEVTAHDCAQIVIDLFRLLSELESKHINHNDLHLGNLIVTSVSQPRFEGISPLLKVVAVDMGSMTDESRSQELPQESDVHQVAQHIDALRLRLAVTDSPDGPEQRLSTLLVDVAHVLSTPTGTQRRPEYADLEKIVRQCFDLAYMPWEEPSEGLSDFSEHYNAITMRPWFVSKLFVDPGDWHLRIRAFGPQIIAGMRGCGKTMLLRTLEVHTRLAMSASGEDVAEEDRQGVVTGEGYVGLYVSCTRLIDVTSRSTGPSVNHAEVKLVLAYVVQALRALRHSEKEFGSGVVESDASTRMCALLASILDAEPPAALGLHSVENQLLRVMDRLERGEIETALVLPIQTTFERIAQTLGHASSLWRNARVLFLLDDLSTRHLAATTIDVLLPRLLFNSEVCAFKITTESQTLHISLANASSTGLARVGRDYQVLDLGRELQTELTPTFVNELLGKRAAQFPRHPNASPANVLGRRSLVEIARQILADEPADGSRLSPYSGIDGLAKVCAGDVSDLITLYGKMAAQASGDGPLPAVRQTEAYVALCGLRLHQMNRDKGRVRQLVEGFADASHELLLRSRVKSGKRTRFREYTRLHVTLDPSDQELRDSLIDLVDSGAFVLMESKRPRVRSSGRPPQTQYVLGYRKILGVSRFVPLGDADRFELSSERFRHWLANPDRSRDILLEKFAAANGEDSSPIRESQRRRPSTKTPDATLFDDFAFKKDDAISERLGHSALISQRLARSKFITLPRITQFDVADLERYDARSFIVGRGFEDRALASVDRVLKSGWSPTATTLVTYPINGRGPEIEQIIERQGQVTKVEDRAENPFGDDLGCAVVDITGLTKTWIFRAVRASLASAGEVLIVHTDAATHYPSNEDIGARMSALSAGDSPFVLLDSMVDVMRGESGDYSFVPLLPVSADDGRRRSLLAAVSPKHERLSALLASREYDEIDIITPGGSSPRANLARAAAAVSATAQHVRGQSEIDSNDLSSMIHYLFDTHADAYTRGLNVEISLTGSKIHAVAAAVLAARAPLRQCWYARPTEYFHETFTDGAGATRAYHVSFPS